MQNSQLDLLNSSNGDFTPVIRASEMELGRYYKAFDMKLVQTPYGLRATVKLLVDENLPNSSDNIRVLFLSPKYSEDVQSAALHWLFSDDKQPYVACISLNYNPKNNLPMAHYKFKYDTVDTVDTTNE